MNGQTVLQVGHDTGIVHAHATVILSVTAKEQLSEAEPFDVVVANLIDGMEGGRTEEFLRRGQLYRKGIRAA